MMTCAYYLLNVSIMISKFWLQSMMRMHVDRHYKLLRCDGFLIDDDVGSDAQCSSMISTWKHAVREEEETESRFGKTPRSNQKKIITLAITV